MRNVIKVEKKIGESKVVKFKALCEGKLIIRSHWWTALVVAFVEKYFPNEKDIWELFIKKAHDRLNNEELISKASSFV